MQPASNFRRLERIAGFLSIWCIFTLIVQFSKPAFTNASKPQQGIADPMLALQLAHNVSDVDAILSDAPSPDREVMRLKQYEDFGYIAGYGALFVALSILLGRRLPSLRLIAALIAICGVSAAILDIVENFRILAIVDVPLAGTTQAMVDGIRNVAVPKWGFGFLAAGLASIYYWMHPRGRARIVGAFFSLGALIGIYGLFLNNPILIVGALCLMVGLLGSVIVFLLIP